MFIATEYGTNYNKILGVYENHSEAIACVKKCILEFSKMHPEFQATSEDFDDESILPYNLSDFKEVLVSHWKENFSGFEVMYPTKNGDIYPYFDIEKK
jgi:hypothetical protein